MIVIMNEIRSEIESHQQTIACRQSRIVTLTKRLADLEEEAMLLRMGTVKNIEDELNRARKNVDTTNLSNRATRHLSRSRATFNIIDPVFKSILYTLKNFESRLKYAELGGDVPACEDKNVRASNLQSNTWPDISSVARTLCSLKSSALPSSPLSPPPPSSPSSCPEMPVLETSPSFKESTELLKTPPKTRLPPTFPPPPPTRALRVRNVSNYSKFFANKWGNSPSRNVQIPPPPAEAPPAEAPAPEDSGPDTFHEAWDPDDLKSLNLDAPFDDKDCWR